MEDEAEPIESGHISQRPVIADVAREAGVSIGLVSRVLNHDETLKVRPQTALRVRKAAEKLGYNTGTQTSAMIRRTTGAVPDDMRRRLRRKRTFTIVQWRDPKREQRDFYYRVLRLSVEKRLREMGYEINEIFDTSPAFPDFSPTKTDGIIAIGTYSAAQFATLRTHCAIIIALGDETLAQGISCVTEDYYGAAQQSLSFFLNRGIDRIGILYGSEYIEDGTRLVIEPRFTAYKDIMESLHIYDRRLAYRGEPTQESGYALMRKVLNNSGDSLPRAFVTGNDAMAIGALRALSEEHVPVPDRVAIIGFDDAPESRVSLPALSTVAVPAEDMGIAAAMMAHDQIMGVGPRAPRLMRFATQLILRGSTPD